MKKAYIKPALLHSSFSLSADVATGISGGCGRIAGVEATSTDTYNCVVKTEIGTIFADLDKCDLPFTSEDEEFDKLICYNNPSDSERLFASI